MAHVIHRLDVGGLENGLVNLINRMPPRYRHAIVCMTEYTPFARRIDRDDVSLFALHKREGKDLGLHLRLWRVLRELQPDIVHTRNLSTMEGVLPATLARVPCRVHGEHGRDLHDLDMQSSKYRWLRRALSPFVHRYIALSRELEDYLIERVGVSRRRVSRIYNGVDTERFRPARGAREPLPAEGVAPTDALVLGTVGRMKDVKDPLTLVRAFFELLDRVDPEGKRLRLVIVGDGPLLPQVRRALAERGVEASAWLPGDRDDVPRLLRGLDVFVLPSLAEGISNGILEAMASGLPVVATRVGGNPELVVEGETGYLVPRADPSGLAAAVGRYLDDPGLAGRHGAAGRRRAEVEFGLDRMVQSYTSLYDSLLRSHGRERRQAA